MGAIVSAFAVFILFCPATRGWERPVISTSLLAIVWPEGYSEVYSPHSCAVSNIDFTVFGPMLTIETSEAIYQFSIRWSERSLAVISQDQQDGIADAGGFPTYWPQSLPPRTGVALYLPISASWAAGDEAPADRVLLDHLHQYYQSNRAEIDAHAAQARVDQELAIAAEAAQLEAQTRPAGPPVVFERIEVSAPTPTPAHP